MILDYDSAWDGAGRVVSESPLPLALSAPHAAQPSIIAWPGEFLRVPVIQSPRSALYPSKRLFVTAPPSKFKHWASQRPMVQGSSSSDLKSYIAVVRSLGLRAAIPYVLAEGFHPLTSIWESIFGSDISPTPSSACSVSGLLPSGN